MKSKKLGRSELLNWINKTIEADYIRIEDLSDGVGFCQVMDAFFKNVSKDMNNLKLNAINEAELKHKNLCLLNSLLGKAGCIKQIGLKRRIEIIKNQSGNKVFKNITRYLPSHLITNEVILQIEKDKFFNDDNSSSEYSDNEDGQNFEEDNELKVKLEKYNLLFKLLEEDLVECANNNKKLNDEINEIEEEKEYYLGKLLNIANFCQSQNQITENTKIKNISSEIIKRINNVPDDFK